MRKFALLTAVLIAGTVHQPAHALTNADVLDKMEQKERHAYILSVMHTTSFFAYLRGNREVSACITSYLDGENGADRLITVLERFRDRTPQATIYTLLKRDCGDPLAGQ